MFSYTVRDSPVTLYIFCMLYCNAGVFTVIWFIWLCQYWSSSFIGQVCAHIQTKKKKTINKPCTLQMCENRIFEIPKWLNQSPTLPAACIKQAEVQVVLLIIWIVKYANVQDGYREKKKNSFMSLMRHESAQRVDSLNRLLKNCTWLDCTLIPPFPLIL